MDFLCKQCRRRVDALSMTRSLGVAGHQHVPGPIFEVAEYKRGDSIVWFQRPANQSSLYRPQSIYPLSTFYIEAVEVIGGPLPLAAVALWVDNARVLSLLPELCRSTLGNRGYELGTPLVIDADRPFHAELAARAVADGSAALVLHGRGFRKFERSYSALMPRKSSQEES